MQAIKFPINLYPQFMKEFLSGQVLIGYQPLQNEPIPDYASLKYFVVPSDKFSDPFETAKQVSNMFADVDVSIYIPGTAFDMHGTRHGRGNGWYDRFLSSVPSQWIRVGLCFQNSFSQTILKREVWDQPVDWVCVQKADGVDYFETNARI